MLKQFALRLSHPPLSLFRRSRLRPLPPPPRMPAAKTANPEDANPLLPTKADMEKARAERRGWQGS